MAIDLGSVLAVILAGALQGFLEWLPVSSSGQLALLVAIAGLKVDPLHLAYALHLGTALAAATRYRVMIVRCVANPRSLELRALLLPLAAGLPLAYLVSNYIPLSSDLRQLTMLIGLLMVVTGILLTLEPKPYRANTSPSNVDLLAIGVLQGVAAAPGLSRSAIVTSYLTYRLGDPLSAVVFTFYTGIPAQVAAGAYGAMKLLEEGSSLAYYILAGILSSAATGYLAIRAIEGLATLLRRKLAWFLIAYGGLIVLLNLAAA
jgi:undecaprenyl-diphosphatase